MNVCRCSAQDSLNGSSSVKSAGRLLEEDYMEKIAPGGASRAGTLSSMSNRLEGQDAKKNLYSQSCCLYSRVSFAILQIGDDCRKTRNGRSNVERRNDR